MKLTKSALLPYPVLGIEGDYKGDYLPTAHFRISDDSDDKKHIIKYNLNLDLSKIGNLLDYIKTGKAIFSFELDCLNTLTRYCQRVDCSFCDSVSNDGEITFEIDLDKRQFAKEVSVTPFISAVESFTLEGSVFNDVYGKEPRFPIEVGDVLAIFPEVKIDVTLDWKHLYNNAGAPMRIEEATGRNAVIETKFGNEIIVMLPTKEYKEFKSTLENNHIASPIILMSLARPAIMTALSKLQNDASNSNAWAMALKTRIDSDESLKEYRPDDGDWDNADLSSWDEKIEKIASLILKGVESKMFNNLRNLVCSQE